MVEYLVALVSVFALSLATLVALKLFVSRGSSLRKVLTNDIVHTTTSAAIVSFVPLTFVLQGDGKKFKVDLIIFAALVAIRFFMMRSSGNWQKPEPGSGAVAHLYAFLTSWAGPIVLGLTYGVLVTASKWSSDASWLTDQPSDSEARWYLITFSAIIAISVVGFVILRRKAYRKTTQGLRMREAINRAWLLPAGYGLFIALLQDTTRNLTFTNRYFTMAAFVMIVVLELWYLVMLVPGWKSRLKDEQAELTEASRKKRKRSKSKRKKR